MKAVEFDPKKALGFLSLNRFNDGLDPSLSTTL
jgi:hypothetical protein